MLINYLTETQNLLNDSEGQFFRIPTLVNYINRARRRIAAVSGCLRCVPAFIQTSPHQEKYPFSDWISLVQHVNPQYGSILSCRSLAVSIGGSWNRDTREIRRGSWKPMWKFLPWTDFQARMRIYNGTFIGTLAEPGWWTQMGSGQNGEIWLAPIPTQYNPMELDLTILPMDLLNDNDACPLPYPWNDAVCYWAATLALLQQQRKDDATNMATTFNNEMPMCASVVCPQMIVNPYGATLRSA